MSKAASFGERLQAFLIKRIEENRLVLPVSPDVAMQVQRQLEDSEIDLPSVALSLEKDPLLAAQVLRIANSPLYRGSSDATSLPQAVVRIGIRPVKNALRTAVAQQIFSSRIPGINESLKGLWNHALTVATVARDLYGISGAKDSDPAYLTGLLHDVGKGVVAAYLLDFEKGSAGTKVANILDHNRWVEIVDDIHRPVGVALAKQWSFPREVTSVINDCVEYDVAERLSPTNAVRFANALVKQHGVHVGRVDQEEVATVMMIGRSLFDLEDETVDKLVNKINEFA